MRVGYPEEAWLVVLAREGDRGWMSLVERYRCRMGACTASCESPRDRRRSEPHSSNHPLTRGGHDVGFFPYARYRSCWKDLVGSYGPALLVVGDLDCDGVFYCRRGPAGGGRHLGDPIRSFETAAPHASQGIGLVSRIAVAEEPGISGRSPPMAGRVCCFSLGWIQPTGNPGGLPSRRGSCVLCLHSARFHR